MSKLNNSYNLFLRRIILPLKRYKHTFSDEDIKKGSILVPLSNNPFDLFREWLREASTYMQKPLHRTFIFATYSPHAGVTARTMKLVDQKDDRFMIIGHENARKFKDLRNYPECAICFWWNYRMKDHHVLRQVRVEGKATELSKEIARKNFYKMPLALQIEFYMSKQSEPVKGWSRRQSEFLIAFNHFKNKKNKLDVPKYITSFEIKGERAVYFLHNVIKPQPYFCADRIKFTKENDKWTWQSIGA